MSVKVRLFASLAEAAGWREREIEIAAGTPAQSLWEALRSDAPGLAAWPKPPLVAINHEWRRADAALSAGDEVAFLPPIAGG